LTVHFDLLKTVDVKFEVMRQKRDRKKRNRNGLLEPNRTTTIHAHCHMEAGHNKTIWDTMDEWNWTSKASTHITQVWRPYTCGSNFSQYFFIFGSVSKLESFNFIPEVLIVWNRWNQICFISLSNQAPIFFANTLRIASKASQYKP
jgi:hypothetical protein